MPVKVALTIGIVLFVSYGWFFQGGGWNQNTRLDLVRAVTEHGALRIDAYAANTGDKARVGGHLYSDKAPGQPLVALAPVALARPLLALTDTAAGTERGTAFLAYVGTVASASLPAVVAALALYWIALALGVSVTGAAVSAIAFGLATPMWAYATLLWSHALASACLVLSFGACVALGRGGDDRRRSLLAGAIGLAGGWAVITDYPVAPAFLIVVALAVTSTAQPARVLLPWIAAGAALPLVVLVVYNTASFGSPFHIGYASEVGFHRLHEGAMGLTYPRPSIVWKLLLGGPRGLLLLAPQLVLAPAGLVVLGRRPGARPAAIAAAAIVVYFVLYNAAYVYWSGGRSYGPRFLAPALPFACLGLGALWDQARRRLRTAVVALTVAGAVLTFGAVATNPQLPSSVRSPFTDVVLPAVGHGAVALGSQSYLEAQPDSAVPTRRDDDSWNIGLLMGLPGWSSILPLAAVWALAAGTLWSVGVRHHGA
jgi:hypothetical protein